MLFAAKAFAVSHVSVNATLILNRELKHSDFMLDGRDPTADLFLCRRLHLPVTLFRSSQIFNLATQSPPPVIPALGCVPFASASA